MNNNKPNNNIISDGPYMSEIATILERLPVEDRRTLLQHFRKTNDIEIKRLEERFKERILEQYYEEIRRSKIDGRTEAEKDIAEWLRGHGADGQELACDVLSGEYRKGK